MAEIGENGETMPDVRRTTVRLSDEARRGWERLALHHGVTMSALMEAVGLRLTSGENEPVPGELIELARRIDYERRRR